MNPPAPATSPSSATSELDACLAPLFANYPGEFDLLLDLRAAWREGRQPGTCVKLYFRLRSHLPSWRHRELEPLLNLLEEKIRLWVVIRESEQRRIDCLGLSRAESLEDYCRLVMREAARRDHRASRLDLSFAWAQ